MQSEKKRCASIMEKQPFLLLIKVLILQYIAESEIIKKTLNLFANFYEDTVAKYGLLKIKALKNFIDQKLV